jgi:hypothetical protein
MTSSPEALVLLLLLSSPCALSCMYGPRRQTGTADCPCLRPQKREEECKTFELKLLDITNAGKKDKARLTAERDKCVLCSSLVLFFVAIHIPLRVVLCEQIVISVSFGHSVDKYMNLVFW